MSNGIDYDTLAETIQDCYVNDVIFEIIPGISYLALICNELHLDINDFISIGNDYFANTHMGRETLYRAAGYDVGKIDFAVPQGWLEQPDVRAKIATGDRPVWSYEGDAGTFGMPIWDSEMRQRVIDAIRTELGLEPPTIGPDNYGLYFDGEIRPYNNLCHCIVDLAHEFGYPLSNQCVRGFVNCINNNDLFEHWSGICDEAKSAESWLNDNVAPRDTNFGIFPYTMSWGLWALDEDEWELITSL
jgi:hypothetical protein